ncbi:Siderophore exporter MmpL4 [BD1-7 clade bacterium]|uniref:Siderophore exporter MmpL4 n=1 Tax=BD1-7 clade bacterium TaxID=2029982 RepID=A0A5S9PNN3_9GAMM|nr:Siderophore exporter MmpL4 [BD1-7 clade bacterium]CAA0106089.1 Siderophore exporter MmpL4 [BD1-7 clade bacterium]
MQRLESWFSRAATHSPLTSFILSLLIMGALIAGLPNLRFDADPGIYFSEDHEHYRLFKVLEKDYGRADSVIMVVKANEGPLFTRENLMVIESLTEQAWTLPFGTRVDSLATYNYSWSEDDELYVESLIENAADLSDADIVRIQDIARSDPDVADRLVSTQAEMAIVRVTATLPKLNRQAEESEMAEATRAVADKIEAEHPNLEILLSGNVISNTEVTNIATNDVMTVIPMMYLVIFVMLGFLLRSITAVCSIIVVTMLSCMGAMGLAAWLGVVLNMMSITAVNIIITVSIAHCVHILVFFLQLYHKGEDKRKALDEALRVNLTPIMLTSVTTALGFLSMNLSKMPPAHDLGNITAIGVVIAFMLSIFLLPPMLLVLPIKRRQEIDGGALNKMMARLAEFVIRRRTPLLIATLLISGSFVALAPMNVMNDKFTENVKLPNEFRADNAELDKYFGGLYTIEYGFEANEEGSISDPEYLQAMDKFVAWLREQPEVRNVHAYSDMMKRLNRNMHNDDPDYYAIPTSRDEAAQYQLMFEISQPFGADMTNTIKQDKSGTRLIVTLPSTDTSNLIALQQRAQTWVGENMPGYMFHTGEGLAVMWSYLGQEALVDGLKGALLALFLISVILTMVFKSFKYGAISLIPNLLPAGVGYGIWAIINGELNMGQMLVLSITIGIVVDDTVHFLTKYLRARQMHNNSAEDAVRYAFSQVGPALWITTAVLVLGFGMLLGSGFIPNANLGMLTMNILIAALLLDFFLLPPLLMLVDGKKRD